MKTRLTLIPLVLLLLVAIVVPRAAFAQAKKPKILVIWGDHIGLANVSAYSSGVMGYETPNIDRIAKRVFVSSSITASKVALPDARRFSPVSTGFAPA